jgi:hypothetical protein
MPEADKGAEPKKIYDMFKIEVVMLPHKIYKAEEFVQ